MGSVTGTVRMKLAKPLEHEGVEKRHVLILTVFPDLKRQQ